MRVFSLTAVIARIFGVAIKNHNCLLGRKWRFSLLESIYFRRDQFYVILRRHRWQVLFGKIILFSDNCLNNSQFGQSEKFVLGAEDNIDLEVVQRENLDQQKFKEDCKAYAKILNDKYERGNEIHGI